MNKTWNYKKLESLVVEKINSLSMDKKNNEGDIVKTDFSKLIKKVDEKMERTLALYIEGGKVPVALLNKQMQALEEEKIQLQNKMQLQEAQLVTIITEKDLKQYSIDLQTSDFSTRQSIIQKLIKQIIIHDESVEIVWNF